jgi:hypothetical protein
METEQSQHTVFTHLPHPLVLQTKHSLVHLLQNNLVLSSVFDFVFFAQNLHFTAFSVDTVFEQSQQTVVIIYANKTVFYVYIVYGLKSITRNPK